MVFKSLHLSCNIIYKGKKKSKSAKNRVKRDNTHQKSTFGASLVYALEVALLQTELYLLQEVNIFRNHASHIPNERIATLMDVVWW